MKRGKFSLSNYKLLSCNMGSLVPVGLTEILPGDSVQHHTSLLVRVSPLLAPVMHPVDVRIHHWFVPHRLVWNDWENFITGGPDGENASIFPTAEVGAVSVGGLSDYLGVPTGIANLVVSALPYRGYAMIWNEWYRDQDLQTALTIDLTDGVDSTTSLTLQNVDWEKDYFTSSRLTSQKGTEVTLPLGDTAPVVSDGLQPRFTGGTLTNVGLQGSASTVQRLKLGSTIVGDDQPMIFGNQTGLETDLSLATSATVNELREAMALQRYKEARQRYGSRYTEYLRYLGVRSSDARLQRPEYLGGGRETIQFSEVLQTGVTTSGNATGVGSLRGHGISAMRSNRYRRFFEEHGYIFSLLSVRPKTIYAQGLPKTWNRRTKEDFYQKELEHIGQEEVLYKELYAGHATPEGTFGFQDRYDTYRRQESTIAGEFRTTLNFWHMARIFSSDPALNATFVSAVPTDRIYQSTATHQLWIMAKHSIQARRLLSQTGSSYIY